MKNQFPLRTVTGGGPLTLLTILFVLLFSLNAQASIRGICSDCHTMHNSQNGGSMNFDGSATPNESLLRGTCFGCHAQSGSSALVSVGVDNIPQVMHTGPIDLAGGNFAFITGAKGSGASDGKGHNIVGLTGKDDDLTDPPGEFHTGTVTDGQLTCAGTNGCHGYRGALSSKNGITGAHHNNRDLSRMIVPQGISDGYRFLNGIVGLEDPDWQFTTSGADHNEYFAVSSPSAYNCATCHGSAHSSDGIVTPDGTISQFCATCHGRFHTLETIGDRVGIGANISSPFIRHPTDIVLPDDVNKEYKDYTTYNLNVPVGRTVAPAMANDTVTPGSDTVICLSCHVTHASDFDDMLRWDYANGCNANTANAACGCFTCHTAKD